jgi:hypothetical protein
MRTLLCSAAAIAISLLTACGSGSGTTVPANIRVVNDTADSVILSLNGLTTIPTQVSNATSAYVAVTPSTYTLSVATSSGLTGASTTVGLGTAQNYTALAYERGKNIYSAVYTDNQAVPSAGFSSLNIANVSSDAGPVDVYLLPHAASGTPSLTGYQPTFTSVQGLSTATTLASTAAATASTPAIAWDIVVTRAAAPSDIRLTLSNPIFASSQAYTLGLTATAGGGLVNAVLIPQGLTTAVYTPATQARVRVWSALPTGSAAAVVTTVGTAQLSIDYAPSPTPYQLVPANSAVTALTVAGTAIGTLPADTFAAGGDYTILVYGTGSPVGAPAALILTDTNQVVANYASVRLINAAVNGSAGLTMYVAGAEGASSVVYPTAATATTAYVYTGVKPASAAPLLLLGAGYTGPQSTAQFTSGSVYTVMVYDAAQAPLITQDR